MPSTSGFSGPTTTKSTPLDLTKWKTEEKLPASIETFSPTNDVPALPGAVKTFSTFSLLDKAHEIACSLPPEPMTKTLATEKNSSNFIHCREKLFYTTP